MDIKKKIKKLPESPGVYIMKSSSGEILYIGKATSIKRRVSNYFKNGSIFSARLQALVEATADIDYILTANEAEALLLEAALIKSNQPKYNIALRDDKNYPLLKLTVNEKFPRLFITRIKKNDGARYFGPFTEAKLLRKALAFLRHVFPLRTCKTIPKTVCLNYYLRQCTAPCINKIDTKGYNEIISQLILFLEGKRSELLNELEEKMVLASNEKRYEEAAGIRDQLKALTSAVLIHKRRQIASSQLEALKEVLHLKKEPRKIEAFDVSNISGKEAVGSMVVFLNGRPYKKGYRRFKIKQVDGIDDYKMLREIVHRRYENLLEEKETPPDMIIIDGGKGHLSSVQDEIEKLGMGDTPIMAIAKEFEHIFILGKQGPLKLPPNSFVLYLIQQIRDEAHRFAIEYHKRLRAKFTSASALDNIRGVGPKRKAALIKHFGSIEGIRRADKAAILEVKGINKRLVRQIKQFVK
ncbi:MAG: excinuclease ABC subunit UvrC [Candidatus Omnitrophica bacterium]|nr:excinuclease ABC subunit UvrC [Candidatus Omnitrophota bacterium]